MNRYSRNTMGMLNHFINLPNIEEYNIDQSDSSYTCKGKLRSILRMLWYFRSVLQGTAVTQICIPVDVKRLCRCPDVPPRGSMCPPINHASTSWDLQQCDLSPIRNSPKTRSYFCK